MILRQAQDERITFAFPVPLGLSLSKPLHSKGQGQ